MMPDLPWGWHLAVLLLGLGGLALLALASEREGELLLRRSVAALLAGTPALAHEPMIPLLQCGREGMEVACEARWSNGVAMPGARYEVTDARDQALLAGVTDRQGRLRFAPPQGVFHVLVWDARGVMGEAGWRDVVGNAR